MSDKELYKLCKKFGNEALSARRKFAGLLPEVFKRRLYEKKGFSSIYEFAGRLAGMSCEQVDTILRLERKFENKPVLQKALVEGQISANKLVRISSIATKENQKEIFEKVKLLSNRAVEIFVRDVKNMRKSEEGQISEPNDLCEPLFDQKSLHVQTLKLDYDVEKELTEMQEKGIDVNEFLRKVLKKRKENIENEKTKVAEAQIGIMPARYVPIKIKKIIIEEHGTKCSIPSCSKPAKILHHTQRFALTKNHDPHFIAPLCEGHHEIAHKIDIKYVRTWAAATG